MRLLVIEDHADLREHLAKGLRAMQFTVDTAADGPSGWQAASAAEHDLVILDRMLPGLDGLEVLRRLRLSGSRVPVLLLTARDSVADRVEGLDAGADDYLPKPFAVAELLARIRALLRRGGSSAADPVVTLGDLEVDTSTRTVRRRGRRIDLSAKEYALLDYLLARPGVSVTREELFAKLYPEETEEASNVVNVLVARLRRKLDPDGTAPLLHTRRGFGYALSPEEM
jgi:two-component system copper resistance phosphate regulon response regulator CusR